MPLLIIYNCREKMVRERNVPATRKACWVLSLQVRNGDAKNVMRDMCAWRELVKWNVYSCNLLLLLDGLICRSDKKSAKSTLHNVSVESFHCAHDLVSIRQVVFSFLNSKSHTHSTMLTEIGIQRCRKTDVIFVWSIVMGSKLVITVGPNFRFTVLSFLWHRWLWW